LRLHSSDGWLSFARSSQAERRSSIHPVPSFLGLCGLRGCTGEFLGFLAHILWINFTGSSTLRNHGERAPERFQSLQATEGVLLTKPLAFLIVALRGLACAPRHSPISSPCSTGLDER
jgi:hypothetical protein